MYRRCPSCTAPLGENRLLETFPVGRRLAFDPEKGRLWVLCPRCRSWNLAPIEERWEPVEEAERAFRESDAGASTEHLSLARHREGTELVRVGRAPIRELAGWRYGRRLVGRWRRHRREGWIATGIFLGLGSIPVAGGSALWILGAWGLGGALLRGARERRPAARVAREGDEEAVIRIRDLRQARLVPEGERGWSLDLGRVRGAPTVLEGPEALSALRTALPPMNEKGGKEAQVRRAVDRVLELGEPDRVLSETSRALARGEDWNPSLVGILPDPLRLARLHPTVRLTLEIAANEEVERRALEGELHLLEREWREAEELAGIIDELVLPAGVRRRLARLRSEAGREGEPS